MRLDTSGKNPPTEARRLQDENRLLRALIDWDTLPDVDPQDLVGAGREAIEYFQQHPERCGREPGKKAYSW
jgi:hypothetical protein